MTILIFISCHKIISLLFITTFPLIQRNKLSKVWGLRRKLNKKQTANNFSISNHAKHFDFRRCSLSPTASVKSNFQQHPRRLIKIPLLISFMIANSSLPFIMQNRGIYAAGVYDRPAAVRKIPRLLNSPGFFDSSLHLSLPRKTGLGEAPDAFVALCSSWCIPEWVDFAAPVEILRDF